MNLGKNGETLIKAFESLRLKAYPDPKTGVDPWTIGWGHTHGVREGMECTPAQAEQWFLEDTSIAVNAVNDLVAVDLNQDQFDAIVSFTYNLGAERLKESTLLQLLNAGNYYGAANEFTKWTSHGMPGLVRRRSAERFLFLSDPSWRAVL